ncbi:tetratricopeptide repeat protein [Candidatus Albibeggiatoa sp. nov. NOAA]|uniref:tetratricopeptide repeat protein n=1 Tax=Candidatus Albibeggiatoa sp. nov. NOAA TaxID=3162724 RepID=UPI0032FF8A70|nr:tetratricopeptide repeat protein [Thiotrichaceae bacterium]
MKKKPSRRTQITQKPSPQLNQALKTAQHYHGQGKFSQAAQIYQQILRAEPNNPDALHLLGVLFAQTGDLTQAEHFIRKAITFKPKDAEYHSHLGNVLKEMGRLESAIGYHEKALKLAPKQAAIHVNLGACLQELEQFDLAIEHYEKALRLEPKNAKILNNLATTFCDNEEYDKSIKYYRRAIRIDPKFAGAYAGLGNVLRRNDQEQEALEACNKALALSPNYLTAYINKGEALTRLERYDEAQACLEHGLALSPNNPEVIFSLGNVNVGRKHVDAAIEKYLQVLDIVPQHKKALYRLSHAYRLQDKLDLAVQYCSQLVELHNQDIELHKLRGFLLLQAAQFTEGWYEYGYRDKRQAYFDKFNLDPDNVVILSRLDTLQGKHIFIHREQGLGDEIFFLRFVPELKRRGAKISYIPGKKVTGLISRQPWLDQLVGQQEPPPKHDYMLVLGNLPLAFGMKTEDLPPPPLRLEAPLPEKVQEIEARLAPLSDKPIIGLTWQAGTKKEDYLDRELPKQLLFKSVDLHELGTQLKGLDAHFISVQRIPKSEDIALLESLLGQPLHDFSDLNDDIEGMLALLDRLDSYVGVSNTNMHLIAGLDKTARVIVPRPYEWRWPGSGDSSVWFPKFKVYRQGDNDDWSTCLSQLRQDLLAQFQSN